MHKYDENYYETLGVAETASQDEIKKAFRSKALKLHPDVNKDNPAAEENFKKLNAAYQILSDESTRADYDAYRSGGFRMRSDPVGYDNGDFFRDFFRHSGFGDFSDFFTGGRQVRQHDVNIAMRLQINIAESWNGAKKQVQISRAEICDTCKATGVDPGKQKVPCTICAGTGFAVKRLGSLVTKQSCRSCSQTGLDPKCVCPTCHGQRVVTQPRAITIDVPAGIASGQTLRIRNMGNMPQSAKPERGDLYVTVLVEGHPKFSRKNDDLVTSVKMTYTQCMLGCKKPVELPDGSTIDVDVPSMSHPGTSVIVNKHGFKNLSTGGIGNMRVNLEMVMPKQLSPEAKELLELYSKFE